MRPAFPRHDPFLPPRPAPPGCPLSHCVQAGKRLEVVPGLQLVPFVREVVALAGGAGAQGP